MVASTASAFTEIEIKSSATSNSGGNSGEGSIQTGNASAKSTVENKINTDGNAGTVKIEAKAEANGEKVEKKVDGSQWAVDGGNTNANAQSTEEDESLNLDLPVKPENDKTNYEGEIQNQNQANDSPQRSFFSLIATSVKNIFNRLASLFS